MSSPLALQPVDLRWVEILLLGIRLIGFPVLVFLVLSPGIAVAFLAVELGLFGFYMGAYFAPNHKGMPIISANDPVDFLRRQVLTSRNVKAHPLTDFWYGGLNYQIEHHLFPSMARNKLREAQPIVRAFCAERGIPYKESGAIESHKEIVQYLHEVSGPLRKDSSVA